MVIGTTQPTFEFDFGSSVVEANVELNGMKYDLSINEKGQSTFQMPVALMEGEHMMSISTVDNNGNQQVQDMSFIVDTSTHNLLSSMDEKEEGNKLSSDDASSGSSGPAPITPNIMNPGYSGSEPDQDDPSQYM